MILEERVSYMWEFKIGILESLFVEQIQSSLQYLQVYLTLTPNPTIDKIFTTRSFWHWVISGSLQALPISIFSYLIMSQRAISEDGYMSSFWVAGSMTFTLAVINANIKIIIMSFMNCVVTLFFVVGSIIFYYVVFIIYDNGLKTTDVYGTLTM